VYLVWGVGWADGLPLEAEAAPIRRRGQDPQVGPLTVLPILDGSNHTAGKREASSREHRGHEKPEELGLHYTHSLSSKEEAA
jgi:hypothetical protein